MMANVTLRLILMKVLECNLADWNSCWRGRRRVVDGAINSPEVKLDGSTTKPMRSVQILGAVYQIFGSFRLSEFACLC